MNEFKELSIWCHIKQFFLTEINYFSKEWQLNTHNYLAYKLFDRFFKTSSYSYHDGSKIEKKNIIINAIYDNGEK